MVNFSVNDMGCALIGGALIAFSATLNLLIFGRITGLSGMYSTLSRGDKSEGLDWKFAFLHGLITIPLIILVGTENTGVFHVGSLRI